MIHNPFSHHSCSVTQTGENQSSSCHFNFSVLSQGLSKHIFFFKKTENYPNSETLMGSAIGGIFQVYSECARTAGPGFTGQLFKLSSYRKKLLGSRDCERGRMTRVWGRKNWRGQIQPESCSSHYIKEGGYVTPVGLC